MPTIPRKATINSVGPVKIENVHNLTYTNTADVFQYNLDVYAKKANSSDTNYQLVGTFDNYKSGQSIQFTDENITKMYKMALPDTAVGGYVDLKYILETWTKPQNNLSYLIGSDEIVIAGRINGSMLTNVNGTWKKSVPFINVNGNWKPCLAYTNLNKTWKKCNVGD